MSREKNVSITPFFFYYWREDSAEGKSDGSKIKRWHFNYRTLIKACGWWLSTRPPLIVPPDVLIKWDRSGGEAGRGGGKGHGADTKQRRSSVGIWEYGCPGPAEMKTHLQTKRAQYPKKRPARWDHGAAGFPSRHIISIGHGKRGHRSSDATENRQPCWMRSKHPNLHLTQIKSLTPRNLKWFLSAVKSVF